MERSYKAALDLLRTTPRKERPTKAWSRLTGKPHWNGLGGMKENLQLLGYPAEELTRLKVIHVAGTKGKGSTCAFIDAFLRAHGERTGFPRKVGLYTSPPMFSVREAIRVNFVPISENIFTTNFFDIRDKVFSHALQNSYRTPGYLQLLTLLSIHTFLKEGIDIAVYETHSGGEYDATNILSPIVTGVTSLGMDHVDSLGPTIEDIAWHKGGIFKPGIPAFSSSQLPAAAKVLQQRALEKGAKLDFTGLDPSLPAKAVTLEPEIQRVNASLALAMARASLKELSKDNLTSEDIIRGLKQYSWQGRFQYIVNGSYHWFLDVAHNELSLKIAGEWFAKTATATQGYFHAESGVRGYVNFARNNPPPERILIFSHASDRDGADLLKCLARALHDNGMQMQHVIFSTLEKRLDGSTSYDFKKKVSPEIQQEYAQVWRKLDANAHIYLQPTVDDALELAKQIGRRRGMQTFITGTTRLIRAALTILE